MATTKKIGFPVSSFRFLEKTFSSVGRVSVPAQASPWQQPLFSWFAGELCNSWQLPRKYGFRFPVSGFQKKPFSSVGRASVPAQVSPRRQPLFSWFAGDFYK
jgi:hypothetical protein